MSKTRPRISIRSNNEPANDSGYETDNDNYDEVITDGNLDDTANSNDNGSLGCQEADYDGPATGTVSLFSTPARSIILVVSALTLFVTTAVVAWLLGSHTNKSATTTYVGSSANTGISGLQTAVKVGALAPDFALNDIYTGKVIRLSSLRGKPVWVNFWASWCGPCKAEMPEMKQLYAKYKDKGLVLLGVDDREDNATVTQFVQLNGYDWTFVIDGDGSILQQYVVSGIPTHLFVDKDGVIRYMVVGGVSAEMMDQGLTKILNQ